MNSFRTTFSLFVTFAACVIISFPSVAQPKWEATNGPFGGRIFSLHVGTNQSVYAGTADGGLYRSDDDGKTWSYSGLAMQSVRTIYRHTDGKIWAGMQPGLAYSSDDGNSWTSLNTSQSVFGIAINSSAHLFVGNWGGLFRSTDNGTSWSEINMGIPSPKVNELFLSKAGTLFAGLFLGGLWRSSNDGTSWVLASNDFASASFDVITQRGTTLYAASSEKGLYRSIDDGVTWTPTSTGPEQGGISAILMIDDQTIIAGRDNGTIIKSTDAGSSWTTAFSVPGDASVYSLANVRAGIILAGTNHGGVFRSTDNGATWTGANSGLTNVSPISMTIDSKGVIYTSQSVSGNLGALHTSTDFGQSWSILPSASSGTPHLAIGPSDVLYAAYLFEGPYHTANHGATWIPDTAGAPRIYISCFTVSAQGDLAIGGDNGVLYSRKGGETQWFNLSGKVGSSRILSLAFIGTALFVGTANDGLYRTKDRGATFEKLASGMTEYTISAITENPGDGVYVAAYGGVYRSTDNGDSWTRLQNTPTGPIAGIVFPSSKTIYIAIQYGGIQFKREGSTTWETLNTGITNFLIKTLLRAPSGALFIGTEGNGIFKLLSSPVSVERGRLLPAAMMLHQNYPNPFQRTTTIRYELAQGTNVRLTIQDALGREFAELVNGYQDAGEHTCRFDADGVISGIYLYRLQTKNSILNKKLVITR